MPSIVPIKIDNILIAIFTGTITLSGNDAKRITMAKISTNPIAIRVESSVARSVSNTSCFMFCDFSIPYGMRSVARICVFLLKDKEKIKKWYKKSS